MLDAGASTALALGPHEIISTRVRMPNRTLIGSFIDRRRDWKERAEIGRLADACQEDTEGD